MIAVLALAGLMVAEPLGQEEAPVAIPASGHEWFSYVLAFPGWAGGSPAFLSGVEEALREPASTTIYCLGATDILEDSDLEGFVRAGGALVIATERKPSPGVQNALITLLGAVPTGIEARSRSPEIPKNAYGGQAACPLAKGKSGHPWFFRQGREVHPATNRPTVLQAFRKGTEAANFTGPVLLDSPLSSELLAASASVGPGRAGLIGDTGLLSNLMFQAPDNIPFALNLVEWAREGAEKPRSRVLLITDGKVLTEPFMPPLIVPPVPLPKAEELLDTLYKGAEGLVQGMEKGLADLEDRDALNRMTDGISFRNWILFLGALGVVALVGILIRFLAGSTAKNRFPEFVAARAPQGKGLPFWRQAGAFIRQTVTKWRAPGRQAIRS